MPELSACASHFDSKVEWHARGVSSQDHATLCGLDGNDPTIGQHGLVNAKPGQKITRLRSRTIWSDTLALKLLTTNFE